MYLTSPSNARFKKVRNLSRCKSIDSASIPSICNNQHAQTTINDNNKISFNQLETWIAHSSQFFIWEEGMVESKSLIK